MGGFGGGDLLLISDQRVQASRIDGKFQKPERKRDFYYELGGDTVKEISEAIIKGGFCGIEVSI